MEDAAPESLLKLMTQLDMVIQIIRLKWDGVCGKCTHILSQDHHHCTMLCIYVVNNPITVVRSCPHKGAWVLWELYYYAGKLGRAK